MNEQKTFHAFLHKLGGYYVMPHELLHVLAYRIIGKSCRYKLGDYRVYSSAKKSRRERLFVLLFPLAVCLTLTFFLHFVWVVLALSSGMPLEEYILAAPKWHFLFHILANVAAFYCGTAYRDVRRAWQILLGKETNRHHRKSQRDAVQE